MAKPTKIEQETIINFNREEDTATIFTYSGKWQRRIEEKLGIEPDEENRYGGKTYTVPKKAIQLPVLRAGRELTDEEKEVVAERFAAARKAKKGKKVKKVKKGKVKAEPPVKVRKKSKVVKEEEEEEGEEDLDDLENLEDEDEDEDEPAPVKKKGKKKGKKGKK